MKTSLRTLVLSTLLLSACNQAATTDQGGSVDSSVLASNGLCTEKPSSNVSINGLENLKSGQKANLSLSSGVNCKAAASATWKVGQTVIGHGSEIQATIQGSGIYILSVTLGSEQQEAGVQNKTASTETISQRIAVTESQMLVVGPQAGTADQEYEFALSLPAETTLTSAQWDFADGSDPVSSLGPVKHSFMQGTYTITVTGLDSNGQSQVASHLISILPVPEGRYCPLDQLEIGGPTDVPLGRPVTYTVNLTECLKSQVTRISWNFGDGSSPVDASSADHAYQDIGQFTISAEIFLNGTSLTLFRTVTVTDNLEEMPGPIPDPTENPNRCFSDGETRSVDGETTSKTVACGVGGQRTETYIDRIVQTCQLNGETLEWTETSRETVLVGQGDCTGQSCELVTEAGTEILQNGQSRDLYTSKLPTGSCESLRQTRLCQNGTLTGSDEAKYLTCMNGCGDFGSHGDFEPGVETGEISQNLTCSFGEEGITSLYQQISDLTCQNGQIVQSNDRLGEIKVAGVCPVYQWAPTEQWSACTADCGGVQNRVFECRNDKGALAPAERCAGVAPQEERVCDGNPEAAAKTETTVTQEEAQSCAACPKNQIGVVVETRNVTKTEVYACQDHQVQVVDTQTVNGPWVKESYCRDLVPHRCSHDSLSTQQARERYRWMKKCEDVIPSVKEFLAEMGDVKYKQYQIDESSRMLYPTFMNPENKKPWIAPKKSSASCEAPAGVYVAAVCVASCATPEQEILAQAKEEKKLKYVPFIEALTQEMPFVGTLHSASTMSSKTVAKSKVDQWVTEFMDTDHEILVFKMKSGGQLKVTTNHPLLSQQGVMKLASDFQVGESLVLLGGRLDPIVSIEAQTHHGKVYNLFVQSSDLKKNVVVINGYLNGTAFYQNEGAKVLNRALFREHLFRGAFETKESRK